MQREINIWFRNHDRLSCHAFGSFFEFSMSKYICIYLSIWHSSCCCCWLIYVSTVEWTRASSSTFEKAFNPKLTALFKSWMWDALSFSVQTPFKNQLKTNKVDVPFGWLWNDVCASALVLYLMSTLEVIKTTFAFLTACHLSDLAFSGNGRNNGRMGHWGCLWRRGDALLFSWSEGFRYGCQGRENLIGLIYSREQGV